MKTATQRGKDSQRAATHSKFPGIGYTILSQYILCFFKLKYTPKYIENK